MASRKKIASVWNISVPLQISLLCAGELEHMNTPHPFLCCLMAVGSRLANYMLPALTIIVTTT